MKEIAQRSGGTPTSQSGTDSEQRLLVVDQLTILSEAFGQQVTEERMRVYCSDLADLTVEQVKLACWKARRELKFFPKIAELRELAGISELLDGRPGVEQAWTMCPKTEEQSTVWTDEIALAFGSARPLINEGDMIGARMAFKEVYTAELERARASRRPVKWNASLGWDATDRVRALSEAVLSKRIATDYALNLLAPVQQEELLCQLPAPERKMLSGEVGSRQQISGMAQILHKLRDTNSMPKELAPAPISDPTPEMSPEEWQERRRIAKEQLEQIQARQAKP